MINFQSYLSIKLHSNYLSSSKPFAKLVLSKLTYKLIFQPIHTTTNQVQQQEQPKPKPHHKHSYSYPEKRVKEPFLSIFLPIQESNQSQSKRNHQINLKSKSMNPIPTHHSNHSNRTIPKPVDSIHPISKVLSKYQTTSQISTTSQLVSEALQSVFHQSNQSNLESCHHTSSDQDWCLIYLKYLQSSKNPSEFSKRLGDLIINRLPRYRSDQIIQSHSKHTSLRHLISTDSYNQLIKFYYLSNRYDQVRLILKEMEEKGLNLNLKSFELILYSYQALNKSKGVKLSIEKIQNLGLSIRLETWVTLFSIKPRQLSKLRHLDSMQDDDSNPILSLDQFLNGWRWDSSELHSNGKAIITLSKKLMKDGKWNEAFKFVDTALTLNHLHDTTDTTNSTKKKLTSFWAREFLHTLLYGLYNIKQENKKLSRIKGIKSNKSSNFETNPIRSSSQTPLPSNQSIFEFVENFIDKHRDYYTIKVNSSILLNCLRIETSHPPSKVEHIIQRWNQNYGLEIQKLGSKTSIRILHIVSTWFYKSIQIQSSREELLKEYSIIKKFWDFELKQMMKRGPIDGKIQKGLFVFWTCQRIQSIQIGLNKINQIKKKLKIKSCEEDELKLDLNFDNDVNKDKIKSCKVEQVEQQLEIQDQVLYKWWSEKPNLKEIKFKV